MAPALETPEGALIVFILVGLVVVMEKEPAEQEITCPRCKYRWRCRSRLLYVTCPNCRRVFKR